MTRYIIRHFDADKNGGAGDYLIEKPKEPERDMQVIWTTPWIIVRWRQIVNAGRTVDSLLFALFFGISIGTYIGVHYLFSDPASMLMTLVGVTLVSAFALVAYTNKRREHADAQLRSLAPELPAQMSLAEICVLDTARSRYHEKYILLPRDMSKDSEFEL